MNDLKPVQTQLGIIFGRDAIFLDEVSHKNGSLVFQGEINGTLCEGPSTKDAWYTYRLTFLGVLAYDCRELEICPWSTLSQFDEAEDSEWLRALNLNKRARELSYELKSMPPRDYVLSTYDLVYRVAATRFELEILADRAKEPPGRERKPPKYPQPGPKKVRLMLMWHGDGPSMREVSLARELLPSLQGQGLNALRAEWSKAKSADLGEFSAEEATLVVEKAQRLGLLVGEVTP